MTPTPNLERAATAASETLIKYHVTSAPVAPLRLVKSIPGVIVLSFTELASGIGMERRDLLDQYGGMGKDAFTLVKEVGGKLRYFVGYNMLLPDYLLQRAIAREMGHIVLQHDGTRPEGVRMAEAMFYARHLLCPRPLIRAIQDADIPRVQNILFFLFPALCPGARPSGAAVPGSCDIWAFVAFSP